MKTSKKKTILDELDILIKKDREQIEKVPWYIRVIKWLGKLVSEDKSENDELSTYGDMKLQSGEFTQIVDSLKQGKWSYEGNHLSGYVLHWRHLGSEGSKYNLVLEIPRKSLKQLDKCSLFKDHHGYSGVKRTIELSEHEQKAMVIEAKALIIRSVNEKNTVLN